MNDQNSESDNEIEFDFESFKLKFIQFQRSCELNESHSQSTKS